jgi:hypothetical protein
MCPITAAEISRMAEYVYAKLLLDDERNRVGGRDEYARIAEVVRSQYRAEGRNPDELVPKWRYEDLSTRAPRQGKITVSPGNQREEDYCVETRAGRRPTCGDVESTQVTRGDFCFSGGACVHRSVIRRVNVLTCRRPILHPSAASRPLNIREPAKGNSRCNWSRGRMIARSAQDTGRGR